MLNEVRFVGKSVSIPKIVVDTLGKESVIIMIQCDRVYRNDDGEYVTDTIPVKLEAMNADVALESALPGSLLGIRGFLESSISPDGEIMISVVGEKLSILTQSRTQDVDRE